MESLTSRSACMRRLQSQMRELTSDSLSLANMLAEEASRLNRQNDVSLLRELCSSIRQKMDGAKILEDAASCGHSEAKLVTSMVGLAVGGIIRIASKDKQLLAFSDYLLKNLGGKQRPFGTVLVSIGPKGLPDDVGVVSISKLARELSREESEVISRIRERGHILLSEDAFSFLIDKLTKDVQEGWLSLPISVQKLSQINASSRLKLEATKLKCVPPSEPPQNPLLSP